MEEIIITLSSIDLIENDSFSNLINLTNLKIENSYVNLLKGNAFGGLNKLQHISLMKTQISSVEKYLILNNLNSLCSINLNGTNIINRNRYNTFYRENIFKTFLGHKTNNLKNLSISIDQLYCNNLENNFDHFENLLIYRNKNKTLTLANDSFTNFTNLKRLDVKLDSELTGIVSEITLDTFSGSSNSLERLNELNLSENWIFTIQPKSFRSLCNLTCLKLSCNGLVSIEKYTFSGLMKLKYLYLKDNCIKTIEKGSFDDFKSTLALLNLKNNSIIIKNTSEFKSEYDLNSKLIIEI